MRMKNKGRSISLRTLSSANQAESSWTISLPAIRFTLIHFEEHQQVLQDAARPELSGKGRYEHGKQGKGNESGSTLEESHG